MAEYDRLTADKGKEKPQAEQAPDPYAEMFRKAVDELNRRISRARLTLSESAILTSTRKRTKQRTGSMRHGRQVFKERQALRRFGRP